MRGETDITNIVNMTEIMDVAKKKKKKKKADIASIMEKLCFKHVMAVVAVNYIESHALQCSRV